MPRQLINVNIFIIVIMPTTQKKPKKSRKTKVKPKKNTWQDFVARYRKVHPDLNYKEAVLEASNFLHPTKSKSAKLKKIGKKYLKSR
jgi:hypothetical protein